MDSSEYSSLQKCLAFFKDNAELQTFRTSLDSLQNNCSLHDDLDYLISVYQQSLPVIEKAIWSSIPTQHTISLYQKVFCELEKHLGRKDNDPRHSFIIVIPVADRPRHLSQCLQSLLDICQLYQYGGCTNSIYSKLYVIVADDSKQKDNTEKHKNICAEYTELGLVTEYLGPDEQIKQLKDITHENKQELLTILGEYVSNPEQSGFYHKGAAITRNIAYLRVNQIIKENSDNSYLIHFIDSDQEFKIIIPDGNTNRELYAINYFYKLDTIFTETSARILTGKVVGDPPVSPAVMASNFLDDIIDFLKQLSTVQVDNDCCFHDEISHNNDDACYHDLADLFGFIKSESAFKYHCTLPSQHDHAACFVDFSNKLNHFFDGEHPTRVTYYDYDNCFSCSTPARTVYTGNYIFKPEGLKYFIAFATLKLRMAGPVLGRIIKAELKDTFVSANLPMLHKRTIKTTGQSEFRPGVSHETDSIDLSTEFERQFYGDIMLFTIDKLTARGYPASTLPDATIKQMLIETESSMLHQYKTKHEQILLKLETLKSLINDDKCWWNNNTSFEIAYTNFTRFINNIELNFGNNSKSYMLVNSEENRKKRHNEILQAFTSYNDDRATWAKLIQ